MIRDCTYVAGVADPGCSATFYGRASASGAVPKIAEQHARSTKVLRSSLSSIASFARNPFLFLLILTTGSFLSLRAEEPISPSSGNIAAALQPFVDNHTLSGAVVLVANRDKVLDLEAVGYSDLETKRAMTTRDLFWIASMSKPMTATALLMLVEEGKVKLDDPVENYLPEFKGQRVIDSKDPSHTPKAPAHPILVREILSHMSGLPFKSAEEPGALDKLPLKTAVESYARGPLQAEPGTDFSYSNAGLNTAGRIIEVVSGMPYEQFMQERLFTPLGMKDTTFWPSEEQLTRLAKSYRDNDDKQGITAMNIEQLSYPLNDRKNRYPMPAGGLFSTAQDVARFARMILNKGTLDGKKYLEAATVEQMITKQNGKDAKGDYGFGWTTWPGGFAHGGAYCTNMAFDANQGFVKILMVQHVGNWGSEQGQKIGPVFDSAAGKLMDSLKQGK